MEQLTKNQAVATSQEAVEDFFFQAEDGIRDIGVTGVQTCALPISREGTAVNPIVNRSTLPGSPPSASTSESTTASSEGRPVTPTRLPSRSRGRRTGPTPLASTAASGRW